MLRVYLRNMTFLFCSALLFTGWSTASELDGHGHHREHGAHEHGVAELLVAVEGSSLMIELRSPAANLLGFEHKARTEEQEAKVHAVSDQLAHADEIFTLSGAGGCKVVEREVESEVLAAAGHHDDHHDHDKHHDDHDQHDDHHQDKHHDDHADHDDHHQDKHHEDHADHDKHHDDHDEHHHDHDESTHSDIVARYQYKCQNAAAVKSIDVMLFKLYPGFEEIDAQVVGTSGQKLIELTAKDHKITL